MLNKSILYDSFGNKVTPAQKLNNRPSKQATGLYGNIYSYGNYSAYRQRYYSLSDTDTGLDSVSRELLVRWSREMDAQLAFINAAIKLMAQFVVGSGKTAYTVKYVGNTKKGKQYEDWLNNEWRYNCCVRGNAYDLETAFNLESRWLDIDGDLLCQYGAPDGYPKFNIIPSNRLRSPTSDDQTYTNGNIVTDGVVYNPDGKVIGYNVVTLNNLVNETAEKYTNTFVSTNSAHLIFDPMFFDKHRGIPSIASGILQCISVQELESYLMEKAKIESTLAYEEKTPTGLAPQGLMDDLNALKQLQQLQQIQNGSSTAIAQPHAIEIIQGPNVHYARANGGGIKLLAGDTTGENTLTFLKRLESQILSLIGPPHQFLYSTEEASGKISDVIMLGFHQVINRKRRVLDRHAKFLFPWAVSVAIKSGLLPDTTEDLSKVFQIVHSELPDTNKYYTQDAMLKQIEAGIRPISDGMAMCGYDDPIEVISKNEEVATEFFNAINRVEKGTNTDKNTVTSFFNNNIIKKDIALDEGETSTDGQEESQPVSNN